MTPNTRTLKGQSYCSQRGPNPVWPKGSKSRGFSKGLHDRSNYPYYGYGHRRLPNEKLSYEMTEAEAEALLRKDLAVRYRLFRKYGKDALLLTVLSYNVGQGVLLGHGGHPKSRLVRKLEAGNRNIYREYVAYCRYKGKTVRSIERRRKMEFLLLYEP